MRGEVTAYKRLVYVFVVIPKSRIDVGEKVV